MRRAFRTILIGLCLVTASYSTRTGKYWICDHPSHKTKTQDRLQSECMPETQAVAGAEEHRKIHPKNVTIFTCAM